MHQLSGVTVEPRRLGLSDLFLPYPSRKNPHLAAASSEAREWARRVKLLSPRQEPFFDEFTDLAAQFYPIASKDGLVLGVFLISWLFFLDDSYDRDEAFAQDLTKVRTLMNGCLDTLFTGKLPAQPGPLHHYSLLFRDRLLPVAGQEWIERFRGTVCDYLMRGSLEVVTSWAQKSTLDLDTYMERRVQDSGVLPCIDLCEVVDEARLPEHLFGAPGIQELRKLCARVIAHANDLVSYQAEVIERDKPNNLVRLLMQHHRLSFEGAVTEAVQMINADVIRFEAVASALPKPGGNLDHALGVYLFGMRSQMRGNLDWSLTSKRYGSPSSPFPELRHA